EKIAVETHIPKDKKGRKTDWVVPIASVIVTFLVGLFGALINNKQANIANEQAITAKEQSNTARQQSDTAKQQSDTAKQQLRINIIKEFGDSIAKLGTNKDDLSRNLEAIKLAQYGQDALPSIKIALGSNDDRVREGVALVVSYIFELEESTRLKA